MHVLLTNWYRQANSSSFCNEWRRKSITKRFFPSYIRRKGQNPWSINCQNIQKLLLILLSEWKRLVIIGYLFFVSPRIRFFNSRCESSSNRWLAQRNRNQKTKKWYYWFCFDCWLNALWSFVETVLSGENVFFIEVTFTLSNLFSRNSKLL